jgi:hypothetical protein
MRCCGGQTDRDGVLAERDATVAQLTARLVRTSVSRCVRPAGVRVPICYHVCACACARVCTCALVCLRVGVQLCSLCAECLCLRGFLCTPVCLCVRARVACVRALVFALVFVFVVVVALVLVCVRVHLCSSVLGPAFARAFLCVCGCLWMSVRVLWACCARVCEYLCTRVFVVACMWLRSCGCMCPYVLFSRVCVFVCVFVCASVILRLLVRVGCVW